MLSSLPLIFWLRSRHCWPITPQGITCLFVLVLFFFFPSHFYILCIFRMMVEETPGTMWALPFKSVVNENSLAFLLSSHDWSLVPVVCENCINLYIYIYIYVHICVHSMCMWTCILPGWQLCRSSDFGRNGWRILVTEFFLGQHPFIKMPFLKKSF